MAKARKPKPNRKPKDKRANRKSEISRTIPSGVMSHPQTITRERELSTVEIAKCGTDLAQQELQLDQVRKEKKEIVRGFDNTIKDHSSTIMQLSQAIDTGILTENIECDVVLNRDANEKTCYPKDGREPFVVEMSSDDYDLLT